jgi:hypothetical protein
MKKLNNNGNDQKKAWIRDVIQKTLDIDKKNFMREITINTGLSEKEIGEQFNISETRIVRDVGSEGQRYDVESRVIISRKNP